MMGWLRHLLGQHDWHPYIDNSRICHRCNKLEWLEQNTDRTQSSLGGAQT